MEPRESLGRASTPEGGRIELVRHPTRVVIYVDDLLLMADEAYGSEVAMADACRDLDSAARILVGGLGMGFTLRAVLDAVGSAAHVLCAELLEPLVTWHREGLVGERAGWPLRDPRVEIAVGDAVRRLEAEADASWDALLLDIDNGPIAMTMNTNAALYGDAGVRNLRRILRPGGRLVVWSADDNPTFTERLRRWGFEARARRVSAWADDEEPKSDMEHVLFEACAR